MKMKIKKLGGSLFATTSYDRKRDYDLDCAETVGAVTVVNYCGNIYATTMQDHIIAVKKRVILAYRYGKTEIPD